MEVEVIFDKFLNKWSIATLGKDGTMQDKTYYRNERYQAIDLAQNIKAKTGAIIRFFDRDGEMELL